uniref:HAUS augmin-like complex subunit 6 N-terminal domain-containing protein n=1 Tax=Sipha flava TaxID=143950 RepID=A0A2S2QV13_9HEMI
MEARINHHIRGIFMLNQKAIPPTLNKHLTNKIFNKPNKEGMEQVLYHLLPLTDPNCLKTLPWPISSFKDAAEFRNAATLIINGLKEFVYEKSSNVVAKVNSSLLANPGGPVFIFFMYQFCLFIKYCELKKKGIDVLNAPTYVDDEYIDKKISMFDGISKSNFNEANEIVSRIDYNLKNMAELSLKYKEIILDSKQRIKDLKLELLNIEHSEATENEVAELKKKYIYLYDKFNQNNLIAMKCAKLADIISKTPKNCNANLINITYNDKDEIIGNYGNIDLVKLLTIIKSSLKDHISWCEQINDEQTIDDNILEVQKSVVEMSEMMQCYKILLQQQNNVIENLEIENHKLDVEIFTKKSFDNIDPRVRSVYEKIPPIVLKTDLVESPKSIKLEYYKKSSQSTILHCSNKPYTYQELSLDDIKDIYTATLSNQNEVEIIVEENEHSSSFNESNWTKNVTLHHSNDHDKSLVDKTTNATLKNQPDKIDGKIGSVNQIKEDEIKRDLSTSYLLMGNLNMIFI